jgi:hypothetical protein
MARPARRRVSRWAAALVTAAVLLVYAANVPFYSGSALGSEFSWRMEHGRLTLKRSPVTADESFYVANNTEGLRFGFDSDYWRAGDWRVTIPLWAPLLLAVGWAAWAWRPRGAAASP